MTAPQLRIEQISHSPRVYVAEGFIAPGAINRILDRYDGAAANAPPGLGWSRSVAGVSGELAIGADPALVELAARIESALGFGSTLSDPTFRFRRYAPGDHHPAHVDCYEIEGHHLVATALVYLTDAAEGGETVFPDAERGPLTIAARRGRLSMWFNYTPDGQVDHRSRHLSQRLVRGDKTTLAYFIYAPLSCAAIEPPGVCSLAIAA